jgi:NAD(P)-dependent dehydrogenase (short-subunit alcohol dehydrogenase family)
VSGRVVLFGATGYTGKLTAKAMAARGMRPILAGRRRAALESLSDELCGAEVAVADVARPKTVRGLVDRGDILVTTVGPMTRWGAPALDAALDARAHYVDSSGEPQFVRKVFEQADRRARNEGIVLLSAMAYDSVPGNLAGALALREAGESASKVRIGYFVTGGRRRGLRAGLDHMSGGSRATFAAMAIEPGFAYRGGRLVTERGSARVGAFEDGDTRLWGVSFGTSEALSLPRLYPNLRNVDVYFGWFDRASRLLQIGSVAMSGLIRIPGAGPGVNALTRRLACSSSAGPADAGTGSLFIAEAIDSDSKRLAAVRLAGINGYQFSAKILAWAAERIASGIAEGAGALGPIEAFGIDQLEAGVGECGIARSSTVGRSRSEGVAGSAR